MLREGRSLAERKKTAISAPILSLPAPSSQRTAVTYIPNAEELEGDRNEEIEDWP
jgi:hypothetical protein